MPTSAPCKPVDSPCLVKPGTAARLNKRPTDAGDADVDKKDAKAQTKKNLDALDTLQEALYANGKHAVLVVFQAIDAGGKDSTIRHVLGPLNPQGVNVSSFKVPSPLEMAHDYLWRYQLHTPVKGNIHVFNRSHYESVIVERVKDLTPEKVWRKRYEQINQWEEMLASEGTLIVKFFLHLSKKEQAERFRDRLVRPDKWWKFSEADLAERGRWDLYHAAFEDALTNCSTPHGPWYAVPADQKWYRDLVVSTVLRKSLESLDLEYPKPAEGMAAKIDEFLAALE